MSSYGRLVAETSDQYFAALDVAQQNFLKSFATFSAFVPAAPMSSWSMPGLPSVQEVTEAGFSFAEKLLKQQQSFMQKLVASSPTSPSSTSSPSRTSSPSSTSSSNNTTSPANPSETPTPPPVAFGKSVGAKSKTAN
jgi:hypothetical protein